MSILETALFYASRGWPVIPVHGIDQYSGHCTCGQVTQGQFKPYHANGKHPYTEHGHKDASTSHAQIHLWFSMWPDANVGIATGGKSGLVVLDVDPKNGGFESLQKLQRRHGTLPKTLCCTSGGGGLHFYFKHPGFEIRGRRGMEPGLDVQADGGRIVAPPSMHQSGIKYVWMLGHGPDEVKIAPLPKWLLTAIQTKKKKAKGTIARGIWG